MSLEIRLAEKCEQVLATLPQKDRRDLVAMLKSKAELECLVYKAIGKTERWSPVSRS